MLTWALCSGVDDVVASQARSGRTLTVEQHRYVMAKFKECALPLYLKLCFQRAVRWASVSTIKGTPVLPPEILLEDADGQGCFVLP